MNNKLITINNSPKKLYDIRSFVFDVLPNIRIRTWLTVPSYMFFVIC
jgi:hypothetical protein